MKKKRERRLPVKAEKEKKRTRYLSTCVIIAHCFLSTTPQDPAPVGTLYSLLKERGLFILLCHQSVESPARIYVHDSHNILFTVMFLFQIGCLLHFKVVWGYMYIIYTKEVGLKFCETKCR